NGINQYIVTGFDIDGCSNKDTIIVTVNPLPFVDFELSSQSVCEGELVQFTNLSDLGATCTWILDSEIIYTVCSDFEFSIDSAGCYDLGLIVETSSGCTNSVSNIDFLCVSVNPIASFSVSD